MYAHEEVIRLEAIVLKTIIVFLALSSNSDKEYCNCRNDMDNEHRILGHPSIHLLVLFLYRVC